MRKEQSKGKGMRLNVKTKVMLPGKNCGKTDKECKMMECNVGKGCWK